MTDRDRHIAFTDGAASGNPGPGGWGAVVVSPDDEVTELGGGEPHTTNNRMELAAAIAALTHYRGLNASTRGIVVHTDSTYVMKGITSWIDAWLRNGWRTRADEEVLNRDLWEQLLAVAGDGVEWKVVRGHRGVAGNERADRIAVAYTQGQTPDLYRGPRSGYGIDVLELEAEEPRARRTRRLGDDAATRRTGADGASSAKRRSRAKAYSYLSLVGNVLRRHGTWPECERRVRGQSGARFKKATSADDEREIIRSWGRDPGEVET